MEYDPTCEWTLHGAALKKTANAKTSSDAASATAPEALNRLVGRLEVRLVRDCVRAGVCVCVTDSLCVYEAVPHVGAQLDHVAEVGSVARMLRAVSSVLQLGTKPTQLLRVVDIAQSLLNDVDNCESVPRCVNMFRSASHFHSGFCRVLELPLQPRPPIPTCHGAATGSSNSSRLATFCATTLLSSGRASRTHTPTRRTT